MSLVFGDCTQPFIASDHDNRTMIQILSNFNKDVLSGQSNWELFGRLLNNFLDITQSEYGFIGERLISKDGYPYLKTQAISNIAWDDSTRKFFEDNAPNGLEFDNLKTLFGEVLVSGNILISNNPDADPRHGGRPEGHPPLNSFMGIPLMMGPRYVGMAGIANRPGGYDLALYDYLGPIINITATLIGAVSLEQVAHYDPLTGLSNRRLFEDRFYAENSRHLRKNLEYSLLILDLDHFKAINDTYGHAMGDHCLVQCAEVLASTTRATDIVARYGGEEFVILLPETSVDLAVMVAEKIRLVVQNTLITIPGSDQTVSLTLSIGLITTPANAKVSLDKLMLEADMALYLAKNNGRNQVRVAPHTAPSNKAD